MHIRKTLLVTFVSLAAGSAALGATASTPSQTQGQTKTPDWYSVEILVFRYTGPNAAQGELWPRTVPAPSLANAIYPSAPGTASSYMPISQTSAAMTQAWQKLENAPGYAPVLETGWTQPGYDTKTTRPVSLAPLPATAPASPTAGATAPAALTAPGNESAPTAQSASLPAVQASGTAMLAVATNKPYVRVNIRLCEPPPANLALQAPTGATASTSALAAMTAMPPSATTPNAPANVPPPGSSLAGMPGASGARQCFALHQSHQVTPGQFQYFDSPAFGVLALVNPVKTPAKAATAPQGARTPE